MSPSFGRVIWKAPPEYASLKFALISNVAGAVALIRVLNPSKVTSLLVIVLVAAGVVEPLI